MTRAAGYSEIELDRGYRRCAADQRIALGGRIERLWRMGDFAFDQAALISTMGSHRP
jgi:hypothetical protein